MRKITVVVEKQAEVTIEVTEEEYKALTGERNTKEYGKALDNVLVKGGEEEKEWEWSGTTVMDEDDNEIASIW